MLRHGGEKYKAIAGPLPLFKSECDVNIYREKRTLKKRS